MAKPLKFHQTLNQQPRSPKHGKHRRARSSSHGYTFVGTDHSAGGSDQDGTVTVTWTTGRTLSFAELSPFTEPKPPTVPSAGIRTGEIIAHRLWWVIEGQLCSLAHRRLWKPNETVHGDTLKVVSDFASLFLGHVIWGGTYGFLRADQLAPEVDDLLGAIEKARDVPIGVPRAISLWGFQPLWETRTFVAGTIKMWGDVIEHERGYRAEYAKLNSIDQIYGPGDLAALREFYGVHASQERAP